MSECHIQIHEVHPWIYKLPRDGDFFLMDVILRSQLSQENQEIFNRVRLNLKLLTVSDIVRAGSHNIILPNIYDGINYRKNNLNWLTQQKLPLKWYEKFKHILKNIIYHQLESTSLGKWVDKGHQTWEYFCYENHKIVHISD